MPYYHIRYTPYDLTHELSEVLDPYEKYIVGFETKKKNGLDTTPHYHIWIQTDLNEDTIRKRFLEKLCIPKAGRGKTNKYLSLKTWNEDIQYIVKQQRISYKKGITEVEIQNGIEKAKSYEKIPNDNSKTIQNGIASKKEKESEWKKILENAMVFYNQNGKREVPYDKWVKLIRYWCLKDLRPFPHPANIKRYAQSLDCLARSDWGLDENELEKQASQIPLPD